MPSVPSIAPPKSRSLVASLLGMTRTSSGLERLFLRGREEDVVEDQPVAGRVLVQREIGGGVPDRVLRVFGVVTAVVRPGSLPVVAMDVLHPRRARLLGENYVAWLDH